MQELFWSHILMLANRDYYFPSSHQAQCWYQRRVLVTGASGFIGANLVRTLLSIGVDVHIFTRETSDLYRLETLKKNLIIHQGILENEEDVIKAIKQSKPDIIFHLATPRGSDRKSLLQGNILGAFHLLEAMHQVVVPHLVMTGSYFEYGPNSEAHKETNPLFPTMWHGAVKAAAGLLLQQAARVGSHLTYLRLFHVYGPLESYQRLIPTAINAAFTNKPIRLSSPHFRRDWIHVFDVINALLKAGTLLSDNNCILNIGSGFEYSVQEIIDCLEKTLNKTIPIDHREFPSRATDQINNCANIDAAAEILKWQPHFSLAKGLAQTVEWFQTHSNTNYSMLEVAPVII